MIDADDICNQRNQFVARTNGVLCYFDKLSLFTLLHLFRAFRSSFYGCELWGAFEYTYLMM